MPAPRLRIGITKDTPTCREFARVGHSLSLLDEDYDPADYDLLIIDAAQSASMIDVVLERDVPRARPGQLVLAFSPDAGVQDLDVLELQGAIVMVAHRVWKDFWVACAADDIGEMVVTALLSEIGGTVTIIDDAQRLTVLAGQRLLALGQQLRTDAVGLLHTVVPSIDLHNDEFFELPDPNLHVEGAYELERMFSAISDSDLARVFLALERRYAAETGALDAELWTVERLGP